MEPSDKSFQLQDTVFHLTLFNIWTLTTMKNCPIAMIFAKAGNFLPNTYGEESLKKCQT